MTTLHVYTSTYNDLWMIRHWVRYWSQFAKKLFVYDDDSTDGTREFLATCPNVEVHSPGFHGIDEILLQDMRRREYKIHSRGKADWVVIGDSDEFHYHPRLLAALDEKKQQGFCAVVSHGYQMFADAPPEGDVLLTDVVKDGFYDLRYSRSIFRPEIDLRVGAGQHSFRIFEGDTSVRAVSFNPRGILRREIASPEMVAKYPICNDDQEFRMLHMKYLGADYVRDRHARGYARLSQRNLANKWGMHSAPGGHGFYDDKWYAENRNKAQRVIP